MDDLAADLRRTLAERVATTAVDDPFLPSALRGAARLDGRPEPAPSHALAAVEGWGRRLSTGPGDPDGPLRYPWELPVAAFLDRDVVLGWRPWDRDLKGPGVEDLERWAQGFWVPAILADTLESLLALDAPGEGRAAGAHPRAADVFRRVRRRVDADLAALIARHEPWSGTFALATFAARPRTLERFYPILTALLMRYVSDATEDGGLVLGRRYPLHRVQLVGPTAQLGQGIVAIGQGLDLLGGIVAFLRERQRADGGWGEEGQATDLLTTLAAASFLARIDPGFAPASAFGAIAQAPEAGRGWSAMDPRDAAFVAAEVAGLVAASARPFTERFRWPHVPQWLLDPKCHLPRFGAFTDMTELVASVPALESARFEVAFLDLADFGAWNKRFGQEPGDGVLELFGRVLRELPGSRVFQDGGDEMIVVGAPGRTGLLGDLRRHLSGADSSGGWRARFAERFPGTWCVPARGIVVDGRGRDLMVMRARGGRLVEPVKRAFGPRPPAEGVIVSADEAEAMAAAGAGRPGPEARGVERS